MASSTGLLVGDILRTNAAARPHAPAASMDERVLSFREFDREANRIAHAARAAGISRGDRVVCWCDTSLDVLTLWIGLSKLGAAIAPANARFGAEEVSEAVETASPRAIAVDAAHAEAAEAVARDAGVPILLRRGGGRGPGIDFDEALSRASDGEPESPGLRETDPNVVFFTSGSTGRPKGVVLSHRAQFLRSFLGAMPPGPLRTVSPFPLFHMAGFTLALMDWQTGGELTVVGESAPESILAAVERRCARQLYLIPALWYRVLSIDVERYDLSTLEFVDTGTSATPPELVAELKERFPGTLTRIVYGSTEAGTGAVLGDHDVQRKPGSVGLPAPAVDLDLTPEGEIRLRSPYLMDGYLDDPEATGAALRDGWYHSGDVGVLDDEGYLTVTGRVREIIRTGGESVAPAEVEEVLRDLPGAAEVAVVGIPDPRWGEVVCAVVVPAGGARTDLEAVQSHCGTRLARYKHPRRLEFVDALPRTDATDKVQRRLLVERIAGGG